MARNTHSSVYGLLLFILLSGCTNQTENHKTETIHLKVHYLDRSLLPPNSTITVSLIDVSLADAESTTISEIKESVNTAPPYILSLPYKKSALIPGHSYSVSATIHQNQRLLYTSTSIEDPFAQPDASDNSPLEIIVEKVRQAPISQPSYNVLLGTWNLQYLDQQELSQEHSNKPASITFTSHGVSGFSGCNGFHGNVESKRELVKFSHLASTMMLCQQEANELERNIHKALNAVRSFDLVNGELHLKSETGKVIMQFKKALN